MFDLLLVTLEMMGLTFAIGFFVALVIRFIAVAADSFDFYSSHQKELLRLRRLKKIRQKLEIMMIREAGSEDGYYSDKRKDYSQGINRQLDEYRGYYHGVSHGVSRNSLFDYYYPEDTHMVYLRKQEEAHQRKDRKASNKTTGKTK